MSTRPELNDEDELDRRLRELPMLPAPAGLRARVMASIEHRDRLAWWQRPFWDWPTAARVAAFVLGVGAAVVALWFGAVMLHFIAVSGAETVVRVVGPVVGLGTSVLVVLGRALGTCLGRMNPSVLIAGGVALGMGYACTVGVGTVCWRAANARR